jgi:hypothetical protein
MIDWLVQKVLIPCESLTEKELFGLIETALDRYTGLKPNEVSGLRQIETETEASQ